MILILDLIDIPSRKNTKGKISINLHAEHMEMHLTGTADIEVEDEMLAIIHNEQAKYNVHQSIKRSYIDLIEADFKYIDTVWVVSIHTLGNAATEDFVFNDERKWLTFYNELTKWWLQTL